MVFLLYREYSVSQMSWQNISIIKKKIKLPMMQLCSYDEISYLSVSLADNKITLFFFCRCCCMAVIYLLEIIKKDGCLGRTNLGKNSDKCRVMSPVPQPKSRMSSCSLQLKLPRYCDRTRAASLFCSALATA